MILKVVFILRGHGLYIEGAEWQNRVPIGRAENTLPGKSEREKEKMVLIARWSLDQGGL